MSDRLRVLSRIALALLALGAATALPGRADWLVTRSGGRVETRGPWEVKGKLVVFTQSDGSLSSLRLAEVDLDASRQASAAPKSQAEKPAPAEPVKKKLAVLTDKDFRKSAPAESPAFSEEAKAESAPKPSSGPLNVLSWERADLGADSFQIQGKLHNTTGELIINAAVEVQLFNEAGEKVGTADALLTNNSIQAEGTTDFTANFPGTVTFTRVNFEAKGVPLALSFADPQAVDQKTPPQ